MCRGAGMAAGQYNKSVPFMTDKPVCIASPFSAVTDFRRLNLTSRVDPCTERVKYLYIFLMAVDP